MKGPLMIFLMPAVAMILLTPAAITGKWMGARVPSERGCGIRRRRVGSADRSSGTARRASISERLTSKLAMGIKTDGSKRPNLHGRGEKTDEVRMCPKHV